MRRPYGRVHHHHNSPLNARRNNAAGNLLIVSNSASAAARALSTAVICSVSTAATRFCSESGGRGMGRFLKALHLIFG